MESHLFTEGKYAGMPLESIPYAELEREYVRNESITPRGRMQAGMVLTKRYGCPSVPLKQFAPRTPVVEAKKRIVAPDLAEQVMQALEWYANQSNGEKARAVLIRLYAENEAGKG